MASRPGVIFPESTKDFLTNLIQLRFGSMPMDSDSIASIADSVSTISSASVESASVAQVLHPRIIASVVQQVSDLSLMERVPDILMATRPPTPSYLIVGIDRISNTIVEGINLSMAALRPGRWAQDPFRTPFGLNNSAAVFS